MDFETPFISPEDLNYLYRNGFRTRLSCTPAVIIIRLSETTDEEYEKCELKPGDVFRLSNFLKSYNIAFPGIHYKLSLVDWINTLEYLDSQENISVSFGTRLIAYTGKRAYNIKLSQLSRFVERLKELSEEPKKEVQ